MTSSTTPASQNGRGSVWRITLWGGILVALQMVILVLVIVLVARFESSDPPPAVETQLPSATDQLLVRVAEAVDAGQWNVAYDHLSAAMILSPERADVFSAVLNAVEAGLASDDPAAADLAWDLYGRADAMVPYQTPAAIGEARRRVDAMQPLFASAIAEPEVDALAVFKLDMQRLFPPLQDKQVPLEVRLQLAAQRRAALDTLVEAVVMEQYTPEVAMEVFWEQVDRIRRTCDRIDQALLEEAFAGVKTEVEHWLSRQVPAAVTKADAEDNAGQAGQSLEQLAVAGQNHRSTIAPYQAAQVRGAVELASRVDAAVDRLVRARSWIYNRQALRRIKAIGEDDTQTDLRKLEALATIHEDRLGDYARKQFAQAWQEAFDQLDAEDDKLQAAQLRIVRSLTP